MKLPTSRHSLRQRRAFTLIELLTVVAIIAVLAAGSVGAYGKIVESTKKTEAKVMATTIANALEQFFTEYSRLPAPLSGGTGADAEAETSAAEGIVMVLLGKESDDGAKQNTRSQDFLDGFKQAKINTKASEEEGATGGGSTKWINGLVYEDANYEIVDPWGNYFKMMIDLDYNNEIDNPNVDQAGQGKAKLRKRVIIWSPGKDKKEETWDDNVMSWD